MIETQQENDAKKYLLQVKKIDLRIKNKLIERQQWKEIAESITANMDGERVQSSGSQEKMADAINKCIDMEAEIDALIDELIHTKREVITTIEQLESPTEYDLLHKRYIQFIELKDIAVIYDKDYTTITTTHGRALQNVQDILDEKRAVG